MPGNLTLFINFYANLCIFLIMKQLFNVVNHAFLSFELAFQMLIKKTVIATQYKYKNRDSLSTF